MAIDNTIALQVKTPSLSDSPLSAMLDMQGKQQDIQGKKISNTSNQAVLNEQQNARKFLSEPSNFMGDDGRMDYNKLNGLRAGSPTLADSYITNMAQADRSNTEANKSIQDLSQSSRAIVGGQLLAASQDPNMSADKIKIITDGLVKQDKSLAPAVDHYMKYVLPQTGDDPQKLSQSLMMAGKAVLTPQAQSDLSTPSGYLANNGQQTGFMNTKPFAGSTGIVPGTMVQNKLPLGDLNNVSINPVTNSPMTTSKDAMGNVIGVTQTPTGSGVPQLGVGDVQAIPQLSNERESARMQLNAAPIMHENNKMILANIDKAGPTGVTGPIFQKIASGLGISFTGAESQASAYDIVGKALERNALQGAASMGPQTNAGLDAQIKANGSLSYNPTAIKTITKLNDAIISGAEAYHPGLEKAIKTNGNNVIAKREFDQQWAQNFDPKIMMIYNAQKAGDKTEVNKIVQELGGKKSAAVQHLMQKSANLHNLSQNGHL